MRTFKKRIMVGNQAYFACIKLFRSTLMSKDTKMKLYKALIRPVVSYGAQAWTLRTVDEQTFRVFERKALRRICGPACMQGEWRLRTHAELDSSLGHADLVRFMKSQTLSWLGHVERMEEQRMPKNILKDKMHGTKRKGRPRKRWMDDVEQDLKTMGVTGWIKRARDRQEWRRVITEAKVHPGL
jgi:hypothetical protein